MSLGERYLLKPGREAKLASCFDWWNAEKWKRIIKLVKPQLRTKACRFLVRFSVAVVVKLLVRVILGIWSYL